VSSTKESGSNKKKSDIRRKKNVFKAALKVKPISMDCFFIGDATYKILIAACHSTAHL